MQVDRLDHLVLTVADARRTCAFYTRVLGTRVVASGRGRTALAFGRHKINLHAQGREIEPKVAHPLPGSADLCFITSVPLPHVIAHLDACGVDVLLGPVRRAGATGPILSVYIRDPDGNLLEIANEL